ncbi:hypothetical protein VKT23_004785 [Stygiomarasmius scandens]|uniref:F-box domain-containing protein n=1 Tax=Marasmiellus scandens TaxID=2682957 RepID=A0ABR1JS39_9AGAR
MSDSKESNMYDPVQLCNQCFHSFPVSPLLDTYVNATFLDKLRDGHTLSDTELHQISENIPVTETEIARYNYEIERLRLTLAGLELQRDLLTRVYDHQRTLISPVRKLPVEVLQQIFSLCSQFPDHLDGSDEAVAALQNTRDDAEPTSELYLPILDVAQTCSLWRKISLSTPSLWTHLDIWFDSLYDRDYESNGSSYDCTNKIDELLRKYLSYSKDLPLSLHVHALGPLHLSDSRDPEVLCQIPEFDQVLLDIVDTLLEQAHRWKSAVLALDWNILQRISGRDGIDWNKKEKFPLLENLFIILDEFDISSYPRDWVPHDQLFNSAPLRRLFIPSYLTEISDKFNLTGLTSLTLNEFSDGHVDILLHCPELERLCILRYDSGDDDLPEDPIPCPRLTDLEINMGKANEYSNADTNTPELLQSLSLPSLTTLIVRKRPSHLTNPVQWSQWAFRAMFLQSHFSLKTLLISNIAITLAEVLQTLKMCPDVTHFTLHTEDDLDVIPPLIRHFDINRDNSISLKHLVHLDLLLPTSVYDRDLSDFRRISIDDQMINSICDMIESRAGSNSAALAYFKLETTGSGRTASKTTAMSRFNTLAAAPGRDSEFVIDA